jgi:hypothetical protein
VVYDFDGDGHGDIVDSDTDGDGKPNARSYDVDGDGQFDYRRLDANGDGAFERDELFASIAGTWRTVYVDSPLAGQIDRLGLIQELDRRKAFVEAAHVEHPQTATVRLTNGIQSMLEKYDYDDDGESDAWLTDVDGDGTPDTLLFDLSGDRRADYAWKDENRNGMIDEAEVVAYNFVQGWQPLSPDVLPFPMPFPALYLP